MKKDDAQKFGTVNFSGKTYVLRRGAEYTNRLLPPSYTNYVDRHTNNGVFDFEMSATADSPEGEPCEVYWIFCGKEERDLDSYNYDNVDRIE